MSPALEKGLMQLSEEYGPMYTAVLDAMLARRAQLASCGIQDEGAVIIKIHSVADKDTGGKTMTADGVRIERSTFTNEAAARVEACIQKYVLHETTEAALDGPNGTKMDPEEAVEFDLVDFPIERDEDYDFLNTGSLEAFHHRATKQRYGF
jgi:hypothetical protein